MNGSACVIVSNLFKKYGGSSKNALNDLSFEIKDGEIFGLLGPNGAGKTTFLSILCGLVKPTAGNVTVYGYTIGHDIDSIKKIMGVVPQDIALYPSISGRDNLMYFGRMYGLWGRQLTKIVGVFLSEFGFDKNSDVPVKKYSGGMKRRINLLAGILHNPRILLLDEPTVGMDVQTQNLILEQLRKLNKEQKMTIIYTSHNMDQAESFCDRIAIMDEGKILASGTPHELMEQEGAGGIEEVFIKLTGKKIRN